MSRLATRCPHCSTRFYLSQQQLQAAAGAVRCGACMQLFNARLFMQGSQQAAEPPIVSPVTRQSEPAWPPLYGERDQPTALKDKPTLDEIELDLDSDDFTAELTRLAREEAEQIARQTAPGAAQRVMPLRSGPAPAPETEPSAEAHRPAEVEKTAEIEVWTDTKLEPEPLVADSHTAEPEPDEPLVGFSAEPRVKIRSRTQAHIEPAIEPLLAEDYQLSQEPEPEPVSLHIDPDNLLTDRTDNDFAERLSALDDEPLQLDWQDAPRKSKRSSALWGLLALLALLGLPVQYLYYNFNQLALQDQTRPWLEALCALGNCQLPSKADISQIQNTNLVVRQHPDFKGALIIDAILYNRAPFSQPFPRLELNFMNSAEQPLASRAFYPHEYLAGELAGSQQMPSQIPIHIALEVLLPDPQASRYGIRFLAN